VSGKRKRPQSVDVDFDDGQDDLDTYEDLLEPDLDEFINFDTLNRFFKTMFSAEHIERTKPLPWASLGLSGPVDRATACAAYRKASAAAHPDLGGSHEKMVQLNQAWEQIQLEMGWE